MTITLGKLKERRLELEQRIAALKGTRSALSTPGITLVAGDHPAAHEFDQEITELGSTILEIDAEISTASAHS
jgi:hypothetical protein